MSPMNAEVSFQVSLEANVEVIRSDLDVCYRVSATCDWAMMDLRVLPKQLAQVSDGLTSLPEITCCSTLLPNAASAESLELIM